MKDAAILTASTSRFVAQIVVAFCGVILIAAARKWLSLSYAPGISLILFVAPWSVISVCSTSASTRAPAHRTKRHENDLTSRCSQSRASPRFTF